MLKPCNIQPLMDMRYEAVCTEPMAEIDKEMTPILAEIITLKRKKYTHPTVRRLFKWLVAPERTGEEFLYVTGPLQHYVLTVMEENFKRYIHPLEHTWIAIPPPYTAKAAAEAMAHISPILEGPWELAAWVLVKDGHYSVADYGSYSKTLTYWLFNVISNSNLCPNPYLRYELMVLIFTMIKMKHHRSLQSEAIESVLFACSYLSMNYLMESKPYYKTFHQMDLGFIMGLLTSIADDNEDVIDEALAENLKNIKSIRVSAQIHDMTCHYAINSNKFVVPKSLYGLTAILKTIYSYVQLNYKDYQNKNPNLQATYTGITSTAHYLNDFLCNFRKSCLTPQLANLTATCILTIMEIVMSEDVRKECVNSLTTAGMLLINLFREIHNNAYDTHLDYFPSIESHKDMKMWLEYKERLIKIQNNYC